VIRAGIAQEKAKGVVLGLHRDNCRPGAVGRFRTADLNLQPERPRGRGAKPVVASQRPIGHGNLTLWLSRAPLDGDPPAIRGGKAASQENHPHPPRLRSQEASFYSSGMVSLCEARQHNE
jgi:hypothetical protein